MKKFGLILLVIFFFVGYASFQKQYAKRLVDRLVQKTLKEAEPELRWHEENAKATVIDLSRGIGLREACALAERYRQKCFPRSLAIMIPIDHSVRWEVPIALGSTDGVMRTLPMFIERSPFAITCEGNPSVVSPAELRKEEGERAATAQRP